MTHPPKNRSQNTPRNKNVHTSPTKTQPNEKSNNEETEVTCQNVFKEIFKKVELLEKKVEQLESALEISSQVNKVLREEVDHLHSETDRLEQYSRRSCLVIDGINPIKNETNHQLMQRIMNLTTNHLNRDNVHPNEFNVEFDKCHPIGQIKDNKQSVIVKFRSNAFRERLYRAKKSTPVGIKFCVSLTKRRATLVDEATKKVADVPNVKFAYADANGNLKLLLNEKTKSGSWALPFNSMNELEEILAKISPPNLDSEQPISHPSDQLNDNNPGPSPGST